MAAYSGGKRCGKRRSCGSCVKLDVSVTPSCSPRAHSSISHHPLGNSRRAQRPEILNHCCLRSVHHAARVQPALVTPDRCPSGTDNGSGPPRSCFEVQKRGEMHARNGTLSWEAQRVRVGQLVLCHSITSCAPCNCFDTTTMRHAICILLETEGLVLSSGRPICTQRLETMAHAQKTISFKALPHQAAIVASCAYDESAPFQKVRDVVNCNCGRSRARVSMARRGEMSHPQGREGAVTLTGSRRPTG